MAVVIQYVVVREGVEKMTFTSKKEADAYDKMLDIADNLLPFLQQAELSLVDDEIDKLSFFLASRKDELLTLLKGTTPGKRQSQDITKKPAKES